MKPLFLKVFASFLASLCLLTIFAVVPAQSLVIPDEFSLGERGLTEATAWEHAISRGLAKADASDSVPDLVPRRIQKRDLNCRRVGNNNKKIKYDEYDYPSLDQMKAEIFPQEKQDILAKCVNIQYFYTNLDKDNAFQYIDQYFSCAEASNFFPDKRGVGYREAVNIQGSMVMASVTGALASRGYNSPLLIPRLASQALADEW